ncbi:MAG: sulfite reductase [Clostridia bacterium]|nr:MAG: sulfite reductase [Clostridia bacterium]
MDTDTLAETLPAGLTPEDLKAGGIIPQRQNDKVVIRCMAPGGRITAARLHKIAEVAEKYGSGEVHLSVRMSPEILYVSLQDYPLVKEELAKVGQEIASCGKRVRVPTACGGCEYNPNGLVDTQGLALEFNRRYFGQDHYHKFKTAFSGCPIDCTRARESDLGFQGQVEPELVAEACSGCELCAEICPERALTMVAGLPVRDVERCLLCGDCLKICPNDALVAGRTGVAVYVGGKHGRHPHVAYPVAELVPEGEIFPVAEAVMAWYRENGRPGERIGLTVDRVGIDRLRRVLKPLIGPHLLQQHHIRRQRWRSVFWAGAADAFPHYGEV